MADYLASIYGTEKDKINCSFYFKIGACRHGERCSRKHVKPTFSPTVLISNVYLNPSLNSHINSNFTEEQLQGHFDSFYEDFFSGIAKYGSISEMHVCDNVGDHLVGNVYVRFHAEEDAERCVEELNNRYYDRRPLYAELSPVTDFSEARCRQHELGECNRGGFCNFMHVRHPTPSLKRELMLAQKAMLRRDERKRLELKNLPNKLDSERHTPEKKSSRKKHTHNDQQTHNPQEDLTNFSPRSPGSETKSSSRSIPKRSRNRSSSRKKSENSLDADVDVDANADEKVSVGRKLKSGRKHHRSLSRSPSPKPISNQSDL